MEPQVVQQETKHRFALEKDGNTAFLEYHREGDQITFTHTEVPKDLEGQGIGGKLAKTALEYAKRERLRVVPRCPFVATYVQRHSEYQGLIDPAYRPAV